MTRAAASLAAVIALAAGLSPSAQGPSGSGPYKILKTARVGGEGGWDWIWTRSS
jgi:hypothetical protein